MSKIPDLILGPDLILRSGMKEVTPVEFFSMYVDLLERLRKANDIAIQANERYLNLLKETTPL